MATRMLVRAFGFADDTWVAYTINKYIHYGWTLEHIYGTREGEKTWHNMIFSKLVEGEEHERLKENNYRLKAMNYSDI